VLRSPVFLGGQAPSMLGDGLAILAVPLIVLQLSRSPLLTVLAGPPGSAGYIAAGLPAGVLADRVDPWLLLIAADILRALIFLALFALTGSKAVTVWLILAIAFAAAVLTVFSDTALTIAVRDVFAGPRLVAANSWLEAANQVGQIIGPGTAGLLASAGLLHVSLLVDALTFLISLVTLTAVRQASHARLAEPALLVVSSATTMPVLLTGNLLYSWAVVGASVTMRALRQALVPRAFLGRVTASWRLGGQPVTLAGAVVAGLLASLLGGDPRPVFAGAGLVTLATVGLAWLAGLRKEDASAVAVTLLGRPRR
jgi:hypothetical protein